MICYLLPIPNGIKRCWPRPSPPCGQSLPSSWHFQKTPDNFSDGLQRCLFNDEMAAFFLRHPNQKKHHALTDACAIRAAFLKAESGL